MDNEINNTGRLNDISLEIDLAKKAILEVMPFFTWSPSMPELCDDLCSLEHREDAARMAIWSLVQEGKLALNKDWKINLL